MKEMLDCAFDYSLVGLIHYCLDRLILEPDVRIRIVVASDVNLTLEHQTFLASDYDEKVLQALASNPCIDESVRKELADKGFIAS